MAPADQLTPMEFSLLFIQAMVRAFLTDMIKEVIWSAESTRPPKVSISKIRYSAPWEMAFRASRRTKAVSAGSISPCMGIIQAFPSPVVVLEAVVACAVNKTGRKRNRANRKKIRLIFLLLFPAQSLFPAFPYRLVWLLFHGHCALWHEQYLPTWPPGS